MSGPLVASINCAQCENATFLLLQIENDFHIVCTQCGYICILQDSINQLKAVKQELGD